MANKNRRTKIVVNAKQQTKLILSMSLVPGLALIAMMAFVCYFCLGLYEEALTLNTPLQNLAPVYLSISGFIIVAGLIIMSNSLTVSHRIAGPTYRLRKSIEQIQQGDVAFRIKLRDKDHLTELAASLNSLLDEFNENPKREFYTREQKAQDDAEQAATTEAAEVSVDDVPTAIATTTDETVAQG